MGSTLPIDVTDMITIIANVTINGDGVVFTLDVSNISGSKYISFSVFDNNDGRYFAGLMASDTKTNIYTASGTIQGVQQVSSTTMYLSAIQYA